MDKSSTLFGIRDQALQRRLDPNSVGRGGRVKNRLLDDSDNNIGNVTTAFPALTADVHPIADPPRILALDAESHTAQMMTVVITNRYFSNPDPPFNLPPYNNGTGLGGPITAILEFGNGSTFTRVEIDAPMGPTLFDGSEPRDGVTIVSVPAGTLRVYARNDANLIPGGILGGSIGSFYGIPALPISSSPLPTKTGAQVDYFTRAAIKAPTRTVYYYRGTLANPMPIVIGQPFFGMVPIPPFAKSVRVRQYPDTIGQSVTLSFASPEDVTQQFGTVLVAAGSPSPTFDVPGTAAWFGLYPRAAGIVTLAAEFDIGL